MKCFSLRYKYGAHVTQFLTIHTALLSCLSLLHKGNAGSRVCVVWAGRVGAGMAGPVLLFQLQLRV